MSLEAFVPRPAYQLLILTVATHSRTCRCGRQTGGSVSHPICFRFRGTRRLFCLRGSGLVRASFSLILGVWGIGYWVPGWGGTQWRGMPDERDARDFSAAHRGRNGCRNQWRSSRPAVAGRPVLALRLRSSYPQLRAVPPERAAPLDHRLLRRLALCRQSPRILSPQSAAVSLRAAAATSCGGAALVIINATVPHLPSRRIFDVASPNRWQSLRI